MFLDPFVANFGNNCYPGNFINKTNIDEQIKQNFQEQIQPNTNSFNNSTNSFLSSKGFLENKSTTTETEMNQDFKFIEKKPVGKTNIINNANIQKNIEIEDPVEKYFNF